MSLTTALSIAQSALRNTSRQTSIVSRNVSDATNPDYARRSAVITSTAPGARSIDVQRAADDLLFKNNLAALSAFEGQTTLYAGMERLGLAVNGADNASSAATAIGKLQQALQTYAGSPSNRNIAENAIDAARQLVRTLNEGTQAIQTFRSDMDTEIASAVGDLNDLLAQFKDANTDIASGTRNGRDVSDSLDRRDALLKQIASIVPISTFTRSDNDMVIMTKDGATLFETVPRTVTFQPQPAYGPGTVGNSIYIDGIPVAAGTGGNTNSSRQDRRPRPTSRQRRRHDAEPARRGRARHGLRIRRDRRFRRAFACGAGLFTWPGAPAIPAAGTLVDGLAGSITLNAAYDSSTGGDPNLLRDGGANGVGYIHNGSAAASYTELLISYSQKLDQPITSTRLPRSARRRAYPRFRPIPSAGSKACARMPRAPPRPRKRWPHARRKRCRTTPASTSTCEMSLLLDLEHTYEASARLIRAVDDMLTSLLQAVR